MSTRLLSAGKIHYLSSHVFVGFRVTNSNRLVRGRNATVKSHGMRTYGKHTNVHIHRIGKGSIITIGTRNVPARAYLIRG